MRRPSADRQAQRHPRHRRRTSCLGAAQLDSTARHQPAPLSSRPGAEPPWQSSCAQTDPGLRSSLREGGREGGGGARTRPVPHRAGPWGGGSHYGGAHTRSSLSPQAHTEGRSSRSGDRLRVGTWLKRRLCCRLPHPPSAACYHSPSYAAGAALTLPVLPAPVPGRQERVRRVSWLRRDPSGDPLPEGPRGRENRDSHAGPAVTPCCCHCCRPLRGPQQTACPCAMGVSSGPELSALLPCPGPGLSSGLTTGVSGNPPTFELRYLPRGALGQPFMASVTRQGHSDATAPEQEADLLTPGVLVGEREREREEKPRKDITAGAQRAASFQHSQARGALRPRPDQGLGHSVPPRFASRSCNEPKRATREELRLVGKQQTTLRDSSQFRSLRLAGESLGGGLFLWTSQAEVLGPAPGTHPFSRSVQRPHPPCPHVSSPPPASHPLLTAHAGRGVEAGNAAQVQEAESCTKTSKSPAHSQRR